MDSYKIIIKHTAEKELRNISQPYLGQIIKRIHSLATNPRSSNAEMMKGDGRYLRIRQGDYRIVYEVSEVDLVITVIKIGHRSDVYRSA